MKKQKKIIFLMILLSSFLFASDSDFPIGEVEVINAQNISVSTQKEEKIKEKKVEKEKNKTLKSNKINKIKKKQQLNKNKKLLTQINNKINKDKENEFSSFQKEENRNRGLKENNSPKIDLKNFVNIKYNKDLLYFSIIPHNETEYNKILDKYGLTNPYLFKKYINSFGSYKAIIINALMYDYKYKKPNIAENFYKLFPKLKHGSFYDRKIRLADYLLRTGRPLQISKILKSSDCISQIKDMYICFYYLGVAKYFQTGNNRNRYLRISSQKIKKAKELYRMK